MAQALIQVAGVYKTYRAFDIDHKDSGIGLWLKNIFRLTANTARTTQALSDVSFDVFGGEVFGIFGANGAGKTTLIRILSGLLQPDQGSVSVQDICDPDHIKGFVSYVSTNGWMGLEWQLTAYENLLLYGNLFGVTGATLRSRCDTTLELFELEPARNKQIAQLSAGMRQKLALARGLILDRPILYLDEPTVSLDVQSSAQIRQIAKDLAANQGRTILITSHNPLDLSICDRILFLHQGRVIALNGIDGLLTPLRGARTIHVTFTDQTGTAHADLHNLGGVRRIQVERANGKNHYWQARLVISEADQPINAIIDWFIERDIPIVNLQLKPMTLQELYEYYVAREETGTA